MLQPSRRDFAKLALTALPAVGLFGSISRLRADEAPAAGKPNSKVNGVQIGLNVPYSYGNNMMSGQETLDATVQLGVSAVELRTQPVEQFMGCPAHLLNNKALLAAAAGAKGARSELRQWRLSAGQDKLQQFRKDWDNAGVLIQIVKVDGIFEMADDELDYVFNLAKALGATAISTEISQYKEDFTLKEDDLKRVGGFGEKHDMWVSYHGHTRVTPEHWIRAFELSPRNAANVDIGHFIAGVNFSPIPFIKKYHERITHIHIKDKKKHEGDNTVFGQGDTPIVETLQLLKENQWPIQATIEFEYKVPKGSTRMAEIAKCVKYCRDALA